MFKLSPRRNHRSHGLKVKHVLQIGLLLGVSIWLLYQVRHSHQNNADLDDEAVRTIKETIKFGRKDLQPHVVDTTVKDVRPKEEEVVRNKIGDPIKPEGNENVERGVWDGRLHEHDNDKVVDETDHRGSSLFGEQQREDSGEEREGEEGKETEESKEKEREEKENESEDKEGEASKEHESVETENEENKEMESEDKANDETRENNGEVKENAEEEEEKESKEEGEESSDMEHEDKGAEENEGYKIEEFSSLNGQSNDGIDAHDETAREEHYKGDDASSAVVHESQNATIANEQSGQENTDVEGGGTNAIELNDRQEETIRNMRETYNVHVAESKTNDTILMDSYGGERNDSADEMSHEESGDENNVEESDMSHPFSTITKDINELQRWSNNSSPQNVTDTESDSTQNWNETGNSEDDSTSKEALLEQTDESGSLSNGQLLDSSENGDSNDSSGNSGAVVLEGQTLNSNSSAGTENESAKDQYDNTDQNEEEKSDLRLDGAKDTVLSSKADENSGAEQTEIVDPSFSQEKDESSNETASNDAEKLEHDDSSVSDEKDESSNGKEQVDSSVSEEKNEYSYGNTTGDAQQMEQVDSSISGEKNEYSYGNTTADARQMEQVDPTVSQEKDESSSENTSVDAKGNENGTEGSDESELHSQEDPDESSNTDSDTSAGQNEQDDPSISQEEKEIRTDLETLPVSLSEGNNREESAAE